MSDFENSLTRIGVFYDGNYFLHVSNYYLYHHPRKARISISGLHNFIRSQVAQEEGKDIRLCQVVDAHYFRGRLSAYDARETNKLYADRVFDDVLMAEGVVTHYLPLRPRGGRKEEKGIDVWLALEAFETAINKNFNVLVLIASDGDYVPLVRKLNTVGTRVMVLSWDFDFTDDFGREVSTRTSQDLLEEVPYPIAMHEIIDNRVKKNDPLVDRLFVPGNTEFAPRREPQQQQQQGIRNQGGEPGFGPKITADILTLKNGYGFIAYPPNNLFFSYQDMSEGDFNDLQEGDVVEFTIGKNFKGEEVAREVRRAHVDADVEGEY